MSQVKVVELNVGSRKKPALPPIVHTIRHQSKKQLRGLIQGLFNNTDDALFELADRSQSDQHQEMYFDSMRLIRLHRKSIETAFVEIYADNFADLFCAPEESHTSSSESGGEDGDYSLLEQDDLEMTVAVSGIVSKVTSHYSLPIMQLTKRLDSIAEHVAITERTNPLGPHALSTAFADSMSNLDVNIKIRIILMKLFERFVMERLGPVYEQANQQLIQAGVLPDLKHKGLRNPGPPPSNASGPDEESVNAQEGSGTLVTGIGGAAGSGRQGSGGGAQAFGFNTVQSLLAGVRAAHPGGAGGGAAAEGGAGAGEGAVFPALNSREIIQVLSQLQSEADAQGIDVSEVPHLSDVRTLILSSTATAKERKSLGQADDDTVNFVGMLFDYILNDRNLAIPMKALISRLQIPIIKLAILDKSFFEKPSHPARALLNELSSAGIGWSSARELKRDALYNKIESVVLGVLNEFHDDPDVFSRLLDDLRAFVSKDNRRNVLVEQRVKDSEVGKARTQSAKLKVQSVINQKAAGLRLPAQAGRFISEIWSRVLTLRCVKHGEKSGEWIGGVSTLDNLLWALQPLSAADDVDRRDQLAVGLLSEVQAGMSELGCPPEEVGEFVAWLGHHLEVISNNDRAYLEDDERPELEEPVATVDELVLAPEPAEEPGDIPAGVGDVLKGITEGTWIEVDGEEDQTLRCKLATITQPGALYVFVNRRGMKVLEKSRAAMVDGLVDRRIRVIDESQVFDRALQSVIGNLRQLQRQKG